jgi:hypothetical protein
MESGFKERRRLRGKRAKASGPLVNAAIAVFALLALGVAGLVAYQKRHPSEPPGGGAAAPETPVQFFDWEPDPDLVEQLGREVDLTGYKVRPPALYKQTLPDEEPPGALVTAWAGAPRGDGSKPIFEVRIMPTPAGQRDPAAAIDAYLESVRSRRAEFSQTQTDAGRIAGRVFGRARWIGAIVGTGQKIHGFCFATTDRQKLILLIGQDAEPHQEQSLRLAEAAAMTFQAPNRSGR